MGEGKNVPKGSESLCRPPPPSLTGEADDSAISHLAERTTDSSVLAGRRTKHPPEKPRTCPHTQHTHTHKETACNRMYSVNTFAGYTLRENTMAYS